MSDLIAIVYPSEAKAEDVRQRLLKMQKEDLIKVSDAVITIKTEAGPVKLNQLVNTAAMSAGKMIGATVFHTTEGDVRTQQSVHAADPTLQSRPV
jgi:uncharacterized membrane protein